VLYGSGYTLFAFLQDDFVTRLGWLTEDQLIDAIAIGQMTPGPIVTTATFIGYVLGGFPGAILATLGIFIPSFIAVAITNPIIPKIRESKILGSVLDGVNVAALGLMAAVTIQLAVAAYGVDAAIGQPLGLGLPFDVLRVLVGIAAAVALFRFKVSSLWLVVGGAVFGGIVSLLV
ncbi:MAG: chromate transporter, partial [Chloroflexi bacterium]|nr:chromate transporter [Chloroflexota bacterium]